MVLGAGFAGLAAARRLAGHPVEVTLVDQHNFTTFQPLLYQVATAGLEPADVAYPVRTIFRHAPNVTFRHGRATAIDTARRAVVLADGCSVPYDQLIVATGAAPAFFGIPGAETHAAALYTLADARRVRNRLLSTLEEVDAHPERFDSGAPVFVVVGGGPTGVETAGALRELLDVSMRRDRLRLDPVRTRVVLVEAGPRLLAGFDPRASAYALDTLRARGVEVRVGDPVAAVASGAVRLASGEELPAAAVVWAGGVTVDGTVAHGVPAGRGAGGRIRVEADLSLAGHPEVFVVGDAAAVPRGTGDRSLCPQLAQVAIQSGDHAARAVLARQAGRAVPPFAYRDKGIMATIGRRAAVAQLRHGLVVRGTLGWVAWLGLHLIELIGFRNRLTVLVNWTWRYLEWPSGPRLIVADIEREPRAGPDAGPEST